MKKNNINLIIIAALALFACSKDTSEMIFNKKRTIKGEIEKIENIFLGSPQEILSSKENIIIIDNTKNNFVKIIDIKNNKLINEFGVKGRGPNELNYFGDAWINELNNHLEIFDLRNKLIYSLSLKFPHEVDFSHARQTTLTIPIKYKTLIYSNICRLSDSLFICSGLLETGRFALVDGNGEYLSSFDDFKFYGEEFSSYSNVENGIALQGTIKGEQHLKKFAFVTTKSACLQLYQFSGQNIIAIRKIKYYIAPPKRVSNSIGTNSEVPFGFMDIATSKDYVFVLYSGKSFAEHEGNAEICSKILVYDWKGNPIEQIEIDKPINKFCYHEKSNSLIGIGILPEPQIITFKL